MYYMYNADLLVMNSTLVAASSNRKKLLSLKSSCPDSLSAAPEFIQSLLFEHWR